MKKILFAWVTAGVSASLFAAADFKLPPCGLLVGHGVYNHNGLTLMGVGTSYTTWQGDATSLYDLTELTAKENQGNLIQYWYGGSGRPLGQANWLAIEDLGVKVPPPDWKNLRNLKVSEFPELVAHAKDRAGAGLLKCMKRCEELGLYSTMIYVGGVNPKYLAEFKDCPHYIGYDFGERFTFRFDDRNAQGSAVLDVEKVANDFRTRVADYIRDLKAKGYGRVCTTSSNFYLDYEVAAGVDFTLFEDCTSDLGVATALSRGLCKQYGLGLWGSHIADEHYGWVDFDHPHRFDALRSEFNLKYLAGAKVIVLESGAWHAQTVGYKSPQCDTPRIPQPITEKWPKDEELQKLALEAEKLAPTIDRNSPYCRSYRKVMSEFYDYVKANGTPKGQPRARIAIAKGNYDLYSPGLDARTNPNQTLAGVSAELAERDPRWMSHVPERGWDLAFDVFFPRPRGVYGDKNNNRLFSGSPYGQVDIVSFAFDNITADFLAKNYDVLIFVGWNTCSPRQYGILCDYVKAGDKLFISIPQLSTDKTRNFFRYTVKDLVNGGDFTELCGTKVKGPGPRFYWAVTPTYEPDRHLGVTQWRRYGVYRGQLAETELPPSAETVLFDHESMVPFCVRIPSGKGEVWLLNSWQYPGAYASEFGATAVEGDVGSVGAVWQCLARSARGAIYVAECGTDRPGDECAYVNWAEYPDEGLVLLANLDLARPHTFDLHRNGRTERVTLAPKELRRMSR